MSIYKSAAGQACLSEWCEAQLESGPWSDRRVVDTGLGPTHLASVGSGERSVLWLPGTNFNAATSGRLASHLGKHVRFHVADLPGQPGLSAAEHPGKDRVVRYGEWADELVQILQAEDQRRLVVAGHSLGAAVSLAATPDPAVAGIVLVCPAGLVRIRISPKLLATSVPWVLRPNRRRSTALLAYMQDESTPVDDELADWMTIVARHTRQVGAPGPLPTSTVARWRNQAVVLAGEVDHFFPPRRLESAAQETLGASVETADRAGHLLPEERADRVLDALQAVVVG